MPNVDSPRRGRTSSAAANGCKVSVRLCVVGRCLTSLPFYPIPSPSPSALSSYGHAFDSVSYEDANFHHSKQVSIGLMFLDSIDLAFDTLLFLLFVCRFVLGYPSCLDCRHGFPNSSTFHDTLANLPPHQLTRRGGFGGVHGILRFLLSKYSIVAKIKYVLRSSSMTSLRLLVSDELTCN